MGNKHRVLNENTFRNSKYIQVVNKQIGCNDFKKFCEDNKDYKGQFDFMLDTFKTFILLRNCFFCDSNLSMNDKVENAHKNTNDYCVLKITNTDENSKSFCYYTDTFPKISDKRMFKRKAGKIVRKTQGYLSKGNEYKKLYKGLQSFCSQFEMGKEK